MKSLLSLKVNGRQRDDAVSAICYWSIIFGKSSD